MLLDNTGKRPLLELNWNGTQYLSYVAWQ